MVGDNKPIIIHVSFKRNDLEDIQLYKWILSNKYKSTFIKSILRKEMNNELNKLKGEYKHENNNNDN
jgi:hypothetical protein